MRRHELNKVEPVFLKIRYDEGRNVDSFPHDSIETVIIDSSLIKCSEQ